jgi:hypothetical protein
VEEDQKENAIVLSEETSEIIEGERFEDDLYSEYQEFREFCRKIPCVICQWIDKKNNQKISYVPELARISDPHHIRTRGAGGPDAENIVPLCREHHSEWGNIGSVQFQVKYNINLVIIAKEIYDLFLNSDILDEAPKKVFAYHQRLLSHLDEIRQATARCAEEVLFFVEGEYAGKPAYEWLGFNSYSAYATAPVARGGLGLKERTAYRLLAMARVKGLLEGDEVLTKELGTYKSELILPVLKTIEAPDERKDIAQAIASMSLSDAIKWKNDRTGSVDRRQSLQTAIYDTICSFMSNSNYYSDEDIENLSWKIIQTIEIEKKKR